MNIEEAIKQKKPFKSETARVLVNLMFTSKWMDNKGKEFFATFDITNKQYNILRILKGADGPISTAEIRERMIDRMSDASRIVDRLEKKELVKKVSCPKDQRKVDVTLSDLGHQKLKKIKPKLEAWQEGSIQLTSKEASQLNKLLDKLRE